MELVREILFGIEKGYDSDELIRWLDFPKEDVIYHIKIMNDYGLIRVGVHDVTTSNSKKSEFLLGMITGLTWEGYDFLDDIRNEAVWKKTQAQIKKTTGTASLEMVKEVAKTIARTILLNGLVYFLGASEVSRNIVLYSNVLTRQSAAHSRIGRFLS